METTIDVPDILCPFYQAQTGQYITCEGAIGKNSKNLFASPFKKTKHMGCYCKTWDFVKCPQYKAVIKKYVGEQEGE